MPRQQFEQVVAQASKMTFKKILLIDDTSVPANGKVTLDIFGTVGGLSEVKSMYFYVDAPTGATSGQHNLEILSNQGAGSYTNGVSNFSDYLQWHYSGWQKATKGAVPSSNEAQLLMLQGIRFDDEVSLRLEYYNFTNVVQNNQRSWVFNVVETQVRK